MSIYTPGMKKPKKCYDCVFCKKGFCFRLRRYVVYPTAYSDDRDENCPLVELSPHGRLIDVDALCSAIENEIDECRWDNASFSGYRVWDLVEDAPTIIPAEEAQECSEN